jgi:hypothetical protein
MDRLEMGNGAPVCQRRDAPMVFGIIPESRSASLRNKRSASPESPPMEIASGSVRKPGLALNYNPSVTNRTEPKTVGQWIRYIVVAVIALFLVWWMVRLYVL